MYKENKHERTRRITAVSVFCALSYICVFLIRFNVSFLTFDLKDSVMAIGAMYFGPVSALIMTAVVSLIEFVTVSDTGIYGLIMNFISSATFCVVASLIYKFRKKLSGALISLFIASVAVVAVMCAANILITPYYMGVPASEVRAIIPTLLLPFNAVKAIVNSSLVMLLYKPFSSALKATGITHRPSEELAKNGETRTFKPIITIVSFLVLAAALVFLFLVLDAGIA